MENESLIAWKESVSREHHMYEKDNTNNIKEIEIIQNNIVILLHHVKLKCVRRKIFGSK